MQLAEPANDHADAWHEALRNVVYMLFLGLEGARKSIEHLVEFEPEQNERIILILISELEAYRFLRQQYPLTTDIRHQRIGLREYDYRFLIPRLQALVEAGRAEEEAIEGATPKGKPRPDPLWLQAYLLLPELNDRYRGAVGADSARDLG